MKFLDTQHVLDQNVTFQETRRVGECHFPNTYRVACQEKSWPGYVMCGVISQIIWRSSFILTLRPKTKILGLAFRLVVSVFTIAIFTHVMHLYVTLRIAERHLHFLNQDCNCKEKYKQSTNITTQRTLRLAQRPSGQCFPSKPHFNFYVSM